MKEPVFQIGQLVTTCGVNETMQQNVLFHVDVMNALGRYFNCDWGEMCQSDKKLNNQAVRNGDDRIFAAYNTCKGKIWIITEADRSATTILFPDEY